MKRNEQLLAAIQAVDEKTVTQLIKEGVDVNAPGKYGRTPLHCAARAGNHAICKILIAAGARPAARDDSFTPLGRTPLWDAAESGSAEVVKLFLDSGLDPNDSDSAGESPLFKASTAPACKALIAAGARVDEADNAGWRPLAFACDNLDVFRALLESGADPFFEVGKRSDLFTTLDDLVKDKDPALAAMLQEFRKKVRKATR